MVSLSDRILGNARAGAPAPLMPADLAVAAAGQIVDLDVRDDLRNGGEPFSRIMAARRELPPGAVLRLRATLEPVPLYSVMARQGLAHWTEQLGPEDWRVWFYTADAASPLEPTGSTLAGDGAGAAAGEGSGEARRRTCGSPPLPAPEPVVLDVRYLEPPEPMVRTLQALESLPADGTLVQLNTRVPQLLLPELEARGFAWEVFEEQPERVRVFIRHREAPSATTADSRSPYRQLDVRVLPPREKHPAIFALFDSLAVGEAFVLVNDHDPVPLRYQFQAERPDGFTWHYLEQGPEIWRVRIGRA